MIIKLIVNLAIVFIVLALLSFFLYYKVVPLMIRNVRVAVRTGERYDKEIEKIYKK